MRSPSRAIIFDLDGVLIESTQAKTQAFRELFADHPEHFDAIITYHESNGGISRFEKFRTIFSNVLKQPLSEATFSFLCQRYAELVLDKVLAAPLVCGTEDFLNQYHNTLLLFVASGCPQEELRYILKRRGLSKYFHGAFGSPRTKSEIVESILVDHRLEPSEVVLVGDSDADLEAAERNGIRFIGRVHPGSPDSWRVRSDLATVKDLVELRARVAMAQCRV